jgi:hypothetical protein
MLPVVGIALSNPCRIREASLGRTDWTFGIDDGNKHFHQLSHIAIGGEKRFHEWASGNRSCLALWRERIPVYNPGVRIPRGGSWLKIRLPRCGFPYVAGG